LEVFLYRKE